VDAVQALFGSGARSAAVADPTPSASPSGAEPTASPTAEPAPGPTGTPGGEPSPGKSTPCPAIASPTPTKPKIAALDAGQPPVALRASTITKATVRMHGLSYDGVVDLPTATGTVKVLRFSMSRSELEPFQLSTPGGPKPFLTVSDRLVLQGNVTFYASRFTGTLLLLFRLTFTPENPPPLVLPEMEFTDCDIDLVYVQTETLTAANLGLRFAA
jgi:hypothetical protein